MQHQSLRKWQKEALEKIRIQRHELLWIFDFDGNSGKTYFGKYLTNNENFEQLPPCKCPPTYYFAIFDANRSCIY